MSEHGFDTGEVVEGSHTKKCADTLCDGCVSLEECAVCSRPEFEHGDGIE